MMTRRWDGYRGRHPEHGLYSGFLVLAAILFSVALMCHWIDARCTSMHGLHPQAKSSWDEPSGGERYAAAATRDPAPEAVPSHSLRSYSLQSYSLQSQH